MRRNRAAGTLEHSRLWLGQRLKPSTLILLATAPFIVYLFVANPLYLRALRAIIGVDNVPPNLWVNLGTYLGVSLLALVLPLLLLKRSASPALRLVAKTLLALNLLVFLGILFLYDFPFAAGIFVTIRATIMAYLAASVLGLILAGLLVLKLGDKTLVYYALAAVLFAATSLYFFTRPEETYTLVGESEGRIAIVSGTPSAASDEARATGADDTVQRPIRSVPSTQAALEALSEGTVSAALLPGNQVPPELPVVLTRSVLPDSARNPAIATLVFAAITGLLTLAGWLSGKHPLGLFAELYIDMLRGIPMLVVILYVGFPLQGAIRDMSGGAIDLSRLARGVIAISLGYAAYMAEIFRAGIQAVPKGQVEAARSLGLSSWQTARYIVLPQALRIVIPPLGNEFIAMLKDTSLLSVISVRDITQRAREFQAGTLQTFPAFNTVALLYISLTLAASSLVKYVERRSRRGVP